MSHTPLQAASRERALAKLLPQNGLLAALPPEVRTRLLPHLGLVNLRARHALLEHGGTSVRAFFPVAGLVSLTREFPDGSRGQAALVGREGVLGLPLFMSGAEMPTSAVVQCTGYSLALGREPLIEEWSRGGVFMRVLLRYASLLQSQVSQLAKCRSEHPVQQQLCRLILMTTEQLTGQDVALPQDFVPRLLGVSADEVDASVRSLRLDGALTVRHDGSLVVQDRSLLQARACECERCIRDEYHRSLPALGDAESPAISIRRLGGPWVPQRGLDASPSDPEQANPC